MNGRFRVLEKRFLLSLLLFGGLTFCGMMGCDRATRYKVLTFFFEGVPPLDGKAPSREPNVIITVNKSLLMESMDSNDRKLEPDKLGQRHSSRHSISRECDNCHVGDLRSGRRELREPVPDLCYGCHTDLIGKDDYLHGPLYVGECLFCHDPHQSAYVHLQKAAQPGLCYRCHQKDDIATIPEHGLYLEGLCTDCHSPHSSPVPKLLKTDWGQHDDPNTID